jgi:hypothetical protein
VGWLSRSGAAERPVKLGEALGALHWVGKKEYTDMPKSQWRNQMLHEAVETGLIELINMDVKKKELKARGEEKMRGKDDPFARTRAVCLRITIRHPDAQYALSIIKPSRIPVSRHLAYSNI